MDIGSASNMKPADVAADLAASMPERIENAHREAEAGDSQGVSSADGTTQRERAVDEVGADLRAQLESIVVEVVDGETTESDDVMAAVIDVVVDDRIERGEIPEGENYRDEITQQLRRDPVVVAELDSIMQSIAREMALREG